MKMRVLLLLGLLCMGAIAAEPPEKPASLDELLRLYRELGMPLPSEDAPLVNVHLGWGGKEPVYTLGFLLKAGEGKNPAEVLRGPLKEGVPTQHFEKPVPVKPEEVEVEKLLFDMPANRFPIDSAIATGIQCHARGHTKLAEALVARRRKIVTYGDPLFAASHGAAIKPPAEYRGQSGDALRMRLASTAWAYWMNRISEPDSDWTMAKASLKKALSIAPALATEPRTRYLRGLEAALAPSSAAAGSIEADIDALVNCTDARFRDNYRNELDARYLKVLRRGFDAVPALIEHLDDPRLTRSSFGAFMNSPAAPAFVGHIVSNLLHNIAAGELNPKGHPRAFPRHLGFLEKEAVMNWWKTAKVAGEEKFLRGHLFDPEFKELNVAPLVIIEARYPRLLSGIHEEILEKRMDMDTEPLWMTIAKGVQPREQKIALLKRGAARSAEFREPAIEALRRIDPPATDAESLKLIDSLLKQSRP